MVIGGIVVLVLVVCVTTGVLLRRRSHDDVHSVEHYHRQLHTLEEMRAHPTRKGGDGDGDGRAGYPSPAFRVGSESSTVRLTDPNKPLVPPVPPPPVPNPAEPVKLGDGGASRPGSDESDESDESGESGDVDGAGVGEDGEEPRIPAVAVTTAGASTATGIPPPSAKGESRAMQSINHRPRRLGAPLAAIAAVTVLIVVLIVTGLHHANPPHHGSTATTVTTAGPATHHPHRTHVVTTTTTAAPVVSLPSAATNHDATYQVALTSYSLALSATSGECWIQATDGTGGVLFSGLLYAGQSHTVPATGPVTVIAGAPNAFSATVNGAPVALPAGFQAPFTLKFLSPGAAASSGASTTGGTGTGSGAQPG
jgi:hypothetical protein